MHYKEILSRLTGISVPLFGVQWNPPPSEVTIARRVLRFLEDRRVLYNIYELEVPDHCVHSVIEIRHFLTSALADCTDQDGLAAHLQAIRTACRRFLDTVQEDGRKLIIRNSFEGGPKHWIFFSALGELRAAVGIHVGAIAVMNGLEINGDLIKILPPPKEA